MERDNQSIYNIAAVKFELWAVQQSLLKRSVKNESWNAFFRRFSRQRREMVSSKNNNISIIKQKYGLVITCFLIALSLQNHKYHSPRQGTMGPFLATV